MTAPRRILPGRVYLVSRSTTQQQFFLRPSKRTNQLFAYALAAAAEETGVSLHVVVVMSNHWHVVLTDREGRLPEFLERVHRAVAKSMNASMRRSENFWSSDKTSVVELVSEWDVIAKMAYVIANPTSAGLVASPREWPGLASRRFGEERVIEKPDVFFDEGEDEVTLRFERPPIFPEIDDAELEAVVQGEVDELERKAHAEMKATGRTFLGARAVLAQNMYDRPKARRPRASMNPRIAAAVPALRIAALAALKRFVAAYRIAYEAWRQGERERMFPAGTYALRVRAGVNCAPLVPA
jgi:putative transposase